MNTLEIDSDIDDEIQLDSPSENEEEFIENYVSDYDPNTSVSSEGELSVEIVEEEKLFASKNGKYIWSNKCLASNTGRVARENVMTTTPGATRYAISRTDDIKSTFLLFLPQYIMKIVITMTNMEGLSVFGDTWVQVDNTSIEAYLGLLLLAGVYRSHGEALESLWDDRKGRPLFKSVMSLRRFQNISRVIRFDKRSDRNERRARDKLAPIREFWNSWESNIRKMYNPSEFITVDEQLVTFRGRCPFKQYIPSKPGKYGIKIWALCDSKSNFPWSLQVYTGKNRNCKPEKEQGRRVVLDLVKNLQGRNVTCDNFFTSHELGMDLLKRKLTLVGTVRKNKTFLPVQITEIKKKPKHHSMFLFDNTNKTTIVGYVADKNRPVYLLSTFHHEKKINFATKKPDIVDFYNATKSGVDTLDQLIRTYTCKRRTNRWPQTLFYNMVDISAYNAYVIFLEVQPQWNNTKKFKRRLFLEELGNKLINAEIMRRTTLPHSSPAKAVVKSSQNASNETTCNSNLKRGRCSVCPYNSSGTKHSRKCSFCSNFICNNHSETLIKCNKCNK